MSRPSLRILTFLILASVLAGPALGAPPAAPERSPAAAGRAGAPPAPANITTNPPPPAVLKPEDALWLSARESLRFQQSAEARRKFEQFNQQFGKDARRQEAWFYQGVCHLNLGQDFQALNIWNRLVQQETAGHSRSEALRLALEQLALYHERKGAGADYEKALEQLRLAFPEHAATAALYRRAAEKKLAARDYPGAVECYRALGENLTDQERRNLELARKLAASPNKEAGALLALANESLAKNEVDLAIGLYETFLKQCPDAPAGEAKTKLGWCWHLKQRYAEAEKLYRQVIEQGAEKDEWRGQSRWQLIVLTAGPNNKAKEAIALCATQGKEYAGEFKGEQALFARAWLYWTQKKWPEAQAAFNELIQAYPETAQRPPIQGYLRDCEAGRQPLKGKLRGGDGDLIRK